MYVCVGVQEEEARGHKSEKEQRGLHMEGFKGKKRAMI